MTAEDSLEKLCIKHAGLHKADHTVMILRPAYLQTNGREVFCGENSRRDTIHITLHGLGQGFFDQRSSRRHKFTVLHSNNHCHAVIFRLDFAGITTRWQT